MDVASVYTNTGTTINTFRTKISDTATATSANFASLNQATKAALKVVSQQRSDLGAVQNRLEHTVNNLDNVVENTTSAVPRNVPIVVESAENTVCTFIFLIEIVMC